MKTINKLMLLLTLAAGIAFASFISEQRAAAAGAYYGGNGTVVINSANTVAGTNGAETNLLVTGGWPNCIGATVISNGWTNFTAIPILGMSHVSIQISGMSTNGTSTSNVVFHVYESVTQNQWPAQPPQFPTNSQGTNTPFVQLGTITLPLVAAASGTATAIASYSEIPRTVATTWQSTDAGIAGISYLYIGQVDCPTNSSLTNYTVTINGY